MNGEISSKKGGLATQISSPKNQNTKKHWLKSFSRQNISLSFINPRSFPSSKQLNNIWSIAKKKIQKLRCLKIYVCLFFAENHPSGNLTVLPFRPSSPSFVPSSLMQSSFLSLVSSHASTSVCVCHSLRPIVAVATGLTSFSHQIFVRKYLNGWILSSSVDRAVKASSALFL